MKILHCIGFYETDLPYREHYYTKKLSENKNDTVYILTSNRSYPFGKLKKRSFKIGMQKIKNNLYLIRNKRIFQLKNFILFPYKQYIDTIKPDIIHIYDGIQGIGAFISLYAKHKKIPVVYEHEQRRLSGSILFFIRNIVFTLPSINIILKNSNFVRSVTPGAIIFLKKYFPNKMKKISFSISTLGYDKKIFFRNENERANFRNKYKIKKDTICIGWTGKIYSYKKLEVIINAFENVSDSKKLFIVGTGDLNYINRLKQISSNNKNIYWITTLFNQQKLREFFNAMDYGIWTMPTISYFEALGTGLPIIIPYGNATSHINTTKVIFYGKDSVDANNCIQSNKKNIETLREIFINLKTSNHGIDNTNKYNWEYIVKKLKEQYKRLIHEKL